MWHAIKIFSIATALGLLLWSNLPDKIDLKLNFFGINIDKQITPPVIAYTSRGESKFKKFETKLGLDLRGGSRFIFRADTSKIAKEDIEDALVSTRDVIEKRVNLFGVSEPVIQTIKSGNIHELSLDLPGIKDPQEAVAQIGKTAQLDFRGEGELDPNIPIAIATQSAMFRLTSVTGLSGKDVKKASVVFNQQNGEPSVQLAFSKEGGQKFAEITKKNIGKLMGIYLDEELLTAPTIQSEIIDGVALITGSFTIDSAKALAISINSGALPLPIKLVKNETIGPTLGAIDVQKSVLAGVCGLIVVCVFMIMIYGKLGVVASIGLILYGLITHMLFRAIPVVLTLPGITGFILSIGMAVDSNILIFERIKEELRSGRRKELALKIGFGKAIDAIKDANIATLLVAFILYNPLGWEFLPQFGLVRGFAITLALGVLTSLFTGVFVTSRLLKFIFQ
jgi:preprotein translocase subunit SecD